MAGVGTLGRGKSAAIGAGMLAIAVMAGGCASTSDLLGGSSKSESPAPGAAPGAPASVQPGTPGGDAVALATADIDCPGVDIRSGAATLLIGSKPGAGEPSALDLRYQGSIVQTARECELRAGTVHMKVGIEGRIITGPAGGAGQIEVPMRMAVVHEGPQPRTVLSKFYRIPVTIGADQSRVNFTQVDQDIAFPLPQPPTQLASYVIYVGFDPTGAPPAKKPPPAKPRRNR